MTQASSAFSDSKRHFKILDALRGVAAIMVVLLHIFEIYSDGDHVKMLVNHGYLAVDFFFMLSGYVMAHAYDDRWDRMTVRDFFKRRLIRLQPMVILGMTIGLIGFYAGACAIFPKVAETPVSILMLMWVLGCLMIPVSPSMEIRGWNEMYPLNGPAWSLFFEYIANILHALVLRRLSKTILSVLVFIAAVALIHLAVTSPEGDIIGGWSTEPRQLRIGFTRLLFPYMAGMLLRRVVTPVGNKNTFLICSLMLIVFLGFPRVGGYDHLRANGWYDSLTIILIFPIIISLGALGTTKNKITEKICTFLGDVSYPIYITHFPLIYIYYAWVVNNKIPISKGAIAGMGLLLLMIFLAYASLKFYDEPVRKWLAKRILITGK